MSEEAGQSMVAKARDTDSERFLISDLCNLLDSYLPHDAVQEVYSAYLFGAEAHEGQHRMSGEAMRYFSPGSPAQLNILSVMAQPVR